MTDNTKSAEQRGWLLPVSLIWAAYAITCFASIATTFAMGWHITTTTGDSVALASVTVFALLPQGLLAPFGGVVADRVNRKTILLACYAFMSVLAFAAVGCIAAGWLTMPAILAFCALVGIRNGFRDPAFNSLMPMLVPEKHLIRINMLDNLLSAGSMILAPALGILLYTAFGLQGPLFLLGVGCLLSMGTLALVSVPTVCDKVHERAAVSLLGGFRALVAHRGMLLLTVSFVFGLMAYGPFDSLMPLLVSTVFAGDGYMASLTSGMFGVGMMAGVVLIMVLGERMRLTRVIAGCALVVGAAIVACGLLPGNLFPALVALVAMCGACCAGFAGPATTLLQRNSLPEQLGRIMGIFNSAMALGMPIGTGIGGLLAKGMGLQSFFLLDGGVMLVVGVLTLSSQAVAALDAGRQQADEAQEPFQGTASAPSAS